MVHRNEDGRESAPCRLFLNRYAKHHLLNSTMSLENFILLCIRIRTLVLLNGGGTVTISSASGVDRFLK